MKCRALSTVVVRPPPGSCKAAMRGLGVALSMLPVWPAEAAAIAPIPLTPHEAIYNVTMASKNSGSDLNAISGTMAFEWTAGCGAWTTDQRVKASYDYGDGQPTRVDSSLSTYEPFNGRSMAFTSRSRRSGEDVDTFTGNAKLSADGSGTILYDAPKTLSFTLPAGSLLPTAHTAEIIRHALAGDRFFNATVFDGSDDEGPMEINTFIGKRVAGADVIKDHAHIDKSLLSVPAWRIRMAFFPIKQAESGPEYEMNAVLQQNGIITDMQVEYRDFTISETLVALKPLPADSCGGFQADPSHKPPVIQKR